MAQQMRALSEETKKNISETIGRAKARETLTESFDTEFPGVSVEIDADTTTYRNGHTETECNITILISDAFKHIPDMDTMPEVLEDVSDEMDELAAVLSGVINKNREFDGEVVFESLPRNSDENTAFYSQTILFNVERP